MSGRKRRFAVTTLFVGAPVLVIALVRVLGAEARELRLIALVWMVAAAWWVTRVLLDPPAVRWDTPRPVDLGRVGADGRQEAYLRLLEGHETSAVADSHLQDALARLTRSRLAAHGVDWDPHAPRAAGGQTFPPELPADLGAALTEPPRRRRRSEIEALLSRIEDL